MILATDTTVSENSVYERVMCASRDLTFKHTNHLKTGEGEEDKYISNLGLEEIEGQNLCGHK